MRTFTSSDGYKMHWLPAERQWVSHLDPELRDFTFNGDEDGPWIDGSLERIEGDLEVTLQ